MKLHRYEFLKEEKDRHCFFNSRVANMAASLQKISGIINIKGLTPYLVDTNSDSEYSYFVGNDEGRKVFIKYGGIGESCENEYRMTKALYEKCPDHFLPIIYYHNDGDSKFIVFEFLDSTPIIDYVNKASEAEKLEIQKQMDVIYYALADSDIMHRDIRPDNFVVTEEGTLVLLDMQYAIRISEPKELDCVRGDKKIALFLGDKYRYKKYEWSDTYSFQKLCETIGVEMSFERGMINNVYRMPLPLIIKFNWQKLVELFLRWQKTLKHIILKYGELVLDKF